MASAYLERQLEAGSNGRTFTYSVWFKLANLDGNHTIIGLSSDNNSTKYVEACVKSNHKMDVQLRNGTSGDNGTYLRRRTNRLFRDTNAWYHFVLRVDSTQASASDRIRIYINGEQETDIDADGTPAMPQNFVSDLNNTGGDHRLGRGAGTSTFYMDGQLAHFHLADGQSYAPSTFGETDATTGEWKPKSDPGISASDYGTNGFFLKFDNSGNMGLDSSGNSHNFTTSGTILQYKDTPSNVMPQLNYNDKYAATISNAGQTVTNENNNATGVMSTMAVATGKWYWEAKVKDTASDTFNVGMRKTGLKNYNVSNWTYSTNSFVYAVNGYIYKDGSQSTNTGATAAVGDIIGFIVDMDAGTVKLQKNGSDIYSGNAVVTGLNTGDFWHVVQGASQASVDFNFGNGYFGTTAIASAGSNGNGLLFEYDVPSGHYGISTKNISGNS